MALTLVFNLALTGCNPSGDLGVPPDQPTTGVTPGEPGVVGAKVLHRLNHAEYDNTTRDLLATTFVPSTLLPPDEITHGFDNIAQALTMSSTHLGAYEVAADRMLDEMMGRFDEITVTYPPVGMEDPGITYLGTGSLDNGVYTIYDGEVSGTATVDHDGIFEISATIHGSTEDAELPILGLWIDGLLVRSVEVDAPVSNPVEVAQEVYLDPGLHRITWSLENPSAQGEPRRSAGLRVYQVIGPLDPINGPTEAYDRFVTCSPAQQGEAACAEEIFDNFLPDAWRRPATQDDVDWALSVYQIGMDLGESWDRSVQHGLKAILLHPRFLYRVEMDPEGEAEHRLDGYELANRLSYFLWSSMPDDLLFAAAADGQLETTEGVLDHALRLMADGRAEALAENLAGQWWNIRKLEEVLPLEEVYPSFDEDLRASMQGEMLFLAEDFFAGNASLSDVLMRQETWIDGRLAQHYGVGWSAGDEGWALMSVPDRSGLFGASGWLTATSNPEAPSAVRRGKWVLENLLCDAPPPPPPDVEGIVIVPDASAGSVREQEEALRSDDFCQSCHLVMDPIGFTFHGFSGVGEARDVDRLGFPIDSTSMIDDVEIGSMVELAGWVITDPRLPRCVVEKTFTYAMGRAPGVEDEGDIDAITEAFVDGGLTFPTLADAIVTSRPFQYRSAPGESR